VDREGDPHGETVRRFRALIALEVALTVASLLGSVALRRTLPLPLQAYLRADDAAPLRASEIAAGVGTALVMAAMVTAWVGLWRFWRIAPALLLGSWIAVGGVTLASGPTVQTAVETALYTAWAVVGGGLLSMSLFSDLRGKFGHRRGPD
jgi:hypothetical protein